MTWSPPHLRAPKTFARVTGIAMPAPSRHRHALAVFDHGMSPRRDEIRAAIADWTEMESRHGVEGDAAASSLLHSASAAVAAALTEDAELFGKVDALPGCRQLKQAWTPAKASPSAATSWRRTGRRCVC